MATIQEPALAVPQNGLDAAAQCWEENNVFQSEEFAFSASSSTLATSSLECSQSVKNTRKSSDSTARSSTTTITTLSTTTTQTEDPCLRVAELETKDDDEIIVSRWKSRLQHENLIDRSKEEARLRECCSYFQETCHPSFILITGPSGSGKSRLAKTLQYAQQQEYYFLSGKFNLRRQLQPYAAIVSAFSQFAPAVIARGDADEVRDSIAAALTQEDATVLATMIPSLEPLLETNKLRHQQDSTTSSEKNCDEQHYSSPSKATGGSSDGVQRFVLVFRSFLRAACSPKHPVVLLLDDLHWADPCSLDVLRSVVADKHKGLVVVGTVDDSSLWMSAKLDDLKKTCCVPIKLSNLDLDGIHQFVSKCLGDEEKDLADCESLVSIVSQHTGGNLLYIKEFLLWAHDTDCLYFRGRWAWDTAAIDALVTDPRSITDFLQASLEENLAPETREVLKVAACLGSHTLDEQLIEYVLGNPVIDHLEEGLAQGVLSRCDGGGYAFVHDKVQEATYRLISAPERELFHLEVGRRLWRRLSQEELDQHVYAVLSQFQIGLRLVTREKERVQLATLCLHAGSKAATSTSYFCTAAVCFELGVALMASRGWKDHYNLTLALHNAGAEMELCMANFDRVDDLVEAVTKRARTPLDKVQALGTRISVLGVTDRQNEAIDLGIEVLASLGERFPSRRFTAHITYEMASILRLLKGKSDEQLMRLPDLQDPQKYACLHILQLMFLHCLLVRPELSPLVSMKVVKITLKHGLSPLACVGFSAFGMLCLSFGNIEKAYRFGQLGMQLLEFSGSAEYIPRVYAAFYGVIKPWKNPIRDSLEPLLRAYRVGLQTGDLEFAHMCSSCYCFLALDAGIPLNVIMQQWSVFEETMVSNQQATLLRISLPFLQSMSFYSDPSADPLSLKGKWVDMKLEERKAKEAGDLSSSTEIKTCCMMVCYMFEAYEEGSKWQEGVFGQLCRMVPTIQLLHLHFFRGMLCLALVAQGNQRRKNMRIANKTLRRLKKWATKTPHNCSEKRFLLEAELASVKGKNDKAYENFICAIALAKDSGILFTEALANERAGYHLFKLGQHSLARSFFDRACAVYDQWGGKAKLLHLRSKLDTMYPE